MCGIFGHIPSPAFRGTDLDALGRSLAASMRDRGPDDSGRLVFRRDGALAGDGTSPAGDGGILLLGHTRLSILDLSPAGRQPMFSDDGRHCVTFNGEIYNYVELRGELESAGFSFRTGTDTEVMLKAFVAWGRRCLSRLTGMFAFVVLDRKAGTLFAARDAFGIKPLFWSAGANGFAFASEIPPLLSIPGAERRAAPQQVHDFLVRGRAEDGPETMIRGIRRLPPGHFLEARVDALADARTEQEILDAVTIRQWRSIPMRREPARISLRDAAAEVRRIFLENVRLHLRSDVPLGVALSGGIDSTAVACAVRALEPDAELHTFSYVADDDAISEEAWTDRAIAACGSRAHRTRPGAGDFGADLDHLVRRLGEPFATTSIYAQHAVMRLVREHGVTVLLEGQGADEMFAGYDRHLWTRFCSLRIGGEADRAERFADAAARWPGREDLARSLRRARNGERPEPPDLPLEAVLRQAALREAGADPQVHAITAPGNLVGLRGRLADDIFLSGLPGLMRHGDRNAMSFSVENRVPFCTTEMAAFALSLPEDLLIGDDGTTKLVLREALRGLVPDDILDRRDKRAFEAPALPWFRRLRPRFAAICAEAESAWIDIGALAAIWEEVLAERRAFDWFYWRVLCYLRWKTLFGIVEAA